MLELLFGAIIIIFILFIFGAFSMNIFIIAVQKARLNNLEK